MAYQIDDIDKRVLDIIAKHESGNLGYYAVYPGKREPEITQMTCAQVILYMKQRTDSGIRSSAMGRYQFIRKTLVETCQAAGIDVTRTLYSPEVQDMLILTRLKKTRKHNSWKNGNLSTDKYMIKLAQEFASMPVPYAMKGASRQLAKGQSYYAGDGLNKAHHDPDTLYTQLEDILAGGTGTVTEIDPAPEGPNGATSPIGQSPKTQVERAVSGTGTTASPDKGHAGAQPIPNTALPAAGDVYVYRVIDPLDDRYDFRTGTHVRDIGLYGTDAVSASPIVATNTGQANSVADSGTVPADDPLEAFGGTGEVVQTPTEDADGVTPEDDNEFVQAVERALSTTEERGKIIEETAQDAIDCLEPVTKKIQQKNTQGKRVITSTTNSTQSTGKLTKSIKVSESKKDTNTNSKQFGNPSGEKTESTYDTQKKDELIATLLNNTYRRSTDARKAIKKVRLKIQDNSFIENLKIVKLDTNKYKIVEK